jgi:hypothetical protein
VAGCAVCQALAVEQQSMIDSLAYSAQRAQALAQAVRADIESRCLAYSVHSDPMDPGKHRIGD